MRGTRNYRLGNYVVVGMCLIVKGDQDRTMFPYTEHEEWERKGYYQVQSMGIVALRNTQCWHPSGHWCCIAEASWLSGSEYRDSNLISGGRRGDS